MQPKEQKTSNVAPNDRQGECRFREDVVRRLLERELAGLPLRTRAVRVDDLPLYVAAIRHFRAWGDALRAAGVNPESVSGRRVWTKERVIRRIRELERQGVAMNARSVVKVDGGLVQVARRFCGSWDGALIAAGFDAKHIRRQPRPWTKSTLIQAIQAHAASGGRVTRNGIRPKSIGKAADRLFGSFDAALVAAGVADQRELHPQWSRTKVQAAICSRMQAGEPVNCVAVIKADRHLYDAARRCHGGWNQALRAAGVDPDSVRITRRQWTRESVVKELRRRVEAGVQPTCISSIRPASLVKACTKLFGSCEAAVEAAGVDPAEIGYFRSPRNGLRRAGRKGSSNARAR